MRTSIFKTGIFCALFLVFLLSNCSQPLSFMAPATSTPSPTVTPSPTITPTITPEIGSIRMNKLDGMKQVYVPAGEFEMGSNNGERREQPVHTVFLDAYWIDQTEVTNSMYAKCVDAGKCTKPINQISFSRDSYYGNPIYADYPVIFVDWNQAKTYCEWAGKQLPTEAEWEKAARGTDGRVYPWGNTAPDVTLANFGNNVEDTTKVGSYADGVSPYGALDMTGNVWEWVADWYGGYPSGEVSNPIGPTSGELRVLRGGSWLNYNTGLPSAYRAMTDPSDAWESFGFRCVSSPYDEDLYVEPIESTLPTQNNPIDTQGNIEPTELPLPTQNNPINTQGNIEPTELTLPTQIKPIDTQINEIDGMTQVYVPAGKFEMGSNDGHSDEQPVHTVYLDAYWIDQTEVTNSMYEKCVDAGKCTEPNLQSSNTRDNYYSNPTYADYPVIHVDWNQAKTYCEWASGRLPTEAEWEKAARGTDGRVHPWGNTTPDATLANFNNIVGDTTQVGSYPKGGSPYGALDMAGNVWEWIADWYGEYPSGEMVNPLGPTTGESRVLRGGSWVYIDRILRSSDRDWSAQSSSGDSCGFRCVSSP